MGEQCPLCKQANGELFHQDKGRSYLRCPNCYLVFVPPHHFVSKGREQAEYDLHQNSAADLGYRKFLGRLFDPLSKRLYPRSKGLDFGSGPGPTLSVMFEEIGHRVNLFDKFYAPDRSVFDTTYDFITATEVVEHLHHPAEELARLWGCLRPGGWLGIMTKRVTSEANFAKWHYKNDVTHVCFWSEQTFEWWGQTHNATVEFVGKDVVILQKPDHKR